MAKAPTNSEQEIFDRSALDEPFGNGPDGKAAHTQTVERLRLLWEQRKFLFKVTGAGLALAVLVALLLPKRYESTARLMPPDSDSGSGMALLASMAARTGSDLGGLASGLLGLKSSSDLFIGILGSQTVQDQLINRFGLMKLYSVRHIEDARKELSRRTALSADRKSGIITITVTDRSPQRAQAMAQVYIDELNHLVAALTTSSAHRERIFLEQRLDAVRKDLESAERDFSQFSSKNSAIDIKAQGKAMVDAAATLQGQLIATQSELEGLRQIYTNNNVRVRSLEARVAELRRQLNKIGGADVQQGAGPADPSSSSLYPSLRELPLLGVPYADLYRRMKVQETVYELLTQQYELAKVQEAKEIPSVKVLDEPMAPGKKSFPPRTAIVALGTLLAMMLGIVWVLARARWDEIDPGDPGKALALEVFSTLRTSQFWSHRNGFALRKNRTVRVSERGKAEQELPGEDD